jgi:hypothetical protein
MLLLGSEAGTSRGGQTDIYSSFRRGYYTPSIGLNPVEWETLYRESVASDLFVKFEPGSD